MPIETRMPERPDDSALVLGKGSPWLWRHGLVRLVRRQSDTFGSCPTLCSEILSEGSSAFSKEFRVLSEPCPADCLLERNGVR
jgi:hypothetical protein